MLHSAKVIKIMTQKLVDAHWFLIFKQTISNLHTDIYFLPIIRILKWILQVFTRRWFCLLIKH